MSDELSADDEAELRVAHVMLCRASNVIDDINAKLSALLASMKGEQDVMPKVDGKSFRCDCGCNVFRSPQPLVFVCNSCSARYIGEREGATP